MNKSNRQLCRDFHLDWEQKPIKTFTQEVFYVWQHNAPDILQNMKNILAVWSKLTLTPQGKITIIKSIALSKFVHLFLSLPNPPGNLLQTLNKMLYQFLWNSGPDRIMSPPTKGVGGGTLFFGTDPVGVGIGVKLLVRSVT